jgi:hypothetical protein
MLAPWGNDTTFDTRDTTMNWKTWVMLTCLTACLAGIVSGCQKADKKAPQAPANATDS